MGRLDDAVDEPRHTREGDMTSYHDAPTSLDGPSARRHRRFSEGIERTQLAPPWSRLGRYSDGLGRSPRRAFEKRIGSFADGIAQRPDGRSARRVGSFSDGLQRGGRDGKTEPRVDSQRSTAEERIAA
jgi:hypothetical protein